jgi:quinol-cytochrome oxidoreductase complex cytochrome b subunit
MNPSTRTPSPSDAPRSERLYAWLDDRFQLQALVNFAKHKYVPVHSMSLWYYFGGISLFLFIVQVITGILLLMYYRSGADSSFESVHFITTKVQFGWLMRSLHSWSANLMVLAIFIHMFSVYFTRSYAKPRELTWFSGIALFGLTLGFGFSGYLLPWNELSFFATRVGTDMTGVLPFVGKTLLVLLRNGEEVTMHTLSRFFGLHVALLPGIFTALLGFHLLLIQRQGMHEPHSWETGPESEKKKMPFFPNFILRDLLVWLIVLNILAVLAVFFPWELGQKADAFASAPAGIKPEWYFVFAFQTLKFIPAHIFFLDGELVGILLFMVGGLLWCTVPLWDRASVIGLKRRQMNYLGIAVVGFIVIMTILGYSLG